MSSEGPTGITQNESLAFCCSCPQVPRKPHGLPPGRALPIKSQGGGVMSLTSSPATHKVQPHHLLLLVASSPQKPFSFSVSPTSTHQLRACLKSLPPGNPPCITQGPLGPTSPPPRSPPCALRQLTLPALLVPIPTSSDVFHMEWWDVPGLAQGVKGACALGGMLPCGRWVG